MACLTFDDGFNKEAIVKILKCLRENKVQCTFFIVGGYLKKYKDLWIQAIKDGHEIAYHTMRHTDLNTLTNKKILADIAAWNKTAKEVLGNDYVIPKIARAKAGHANERVRRLFHSLGYTLIHWSSDSLTGTKDHSPKGIAKFIIRQTKVGSISLQHFNGMDAPSVNLYIKKLKAKFKLGTISEALAASAENTK